MKRRVIITAPPQAQSGLEVKMGNLRAGLGFNANKMPWPIMAGKMSEPKLEVNSTLKPVPREVANLEAEDGEVAALPTKSGIPDTFKIGGKRHYEGGTPLNLPSDSFIFSDTSKMRIKDPVILAQFGMPERKNGYTPAEIAKKYDINSFKKILINPDTDKLQKDTAELMISNYNLKLAKLAIIQESMKGFPQGIPAVAMPYIEEMEIDPAQFVQMNPGGAQDEQAATQQTQMDDMGAEARFGGYMEDGGYIDYFQGGGPVTPFVYQAPSTFSNYTTLPEEIDPEIANILAQRNKFAESLKQGQEDIYRQTQAKEEEQMKKAREIILKNAEDKAREKTNFTTASLKFSISGIQKKLQDLYLAEQNIKNLLKNKDELDTRDLYEASSNLSKVKSEREKLKKEMKDTMIKINSINPPSTYYKHDDGLYSVPPSKPSTVNYGTPSWVDNVNKNLDQNAKQVLSEKPVKTETVKQASSKKPELNTEYEDVSDTVLSNEDIAKYAKEGWKFIYNGKKYN
jgi:hypothetical protein